MHSPQFSGQGYGASTQLSSCVGRLKRWYIPPQYRHFTLLYGQILLWSFSWARRNEPAQPCWHFLSEYSHCAWRLSFSWCSPLQEHPGTVHYTLILAMIACRGTEMLNWVWLIVARQSEQLFERPWLLTNCNMQSLQALWPRERDTGLFISSLLKTNQKILRVLSFVSKKEI